VIKLCTTYTHRVSIYKKTIGHKLKSSHLIKVSKPFEIFVKVQIIKTIEAMASILSSTSTFFQQFKCGVGLVVETCSSRTERRRWAPARRWKRWGWSCRPTRIRSSPAPTRCWKWGPQCTLPGLPPYWTRTCSSSRRKVPGAECLWGLTSALFPPFWI